LFGASFRLLPVLDIVYVEGQFKSYRIPQSEKVKGKLPMGIHVNLNLVQMLPILCNVGFVGEETS
jgi:hypothetical protein